MLTPCPGRLLLAHLPLPPSLLPAALPCPHPLLRSAPSFAPPPPEQVPDCDAPGFWDVMDRMVGYNEKLIAIDRSEAPEFLKKLQKLPYTERILAGCLQLFFMPTLRSGSFDIEGAGSYQY